jgi:hypothetical protein
VKVEESEWLSDFETDDESVTDVFEGDVENERDELAVSDFDQDWLKVPVSVCDPE